MIFIPYTTQVSWQSTLSLGIYTIIYLQIQNISVAMPVTAIETLIRIVSTPIPVIYVLIMMAILCTMIAESWFPTPRPRQFPNLPPFLLLPWPLPHVAGRLKAKILARWLNPDHPRYLSNAVLHRGGSGRPAPLGRPTTPPTTHYHEPPPQYTNHSATTPTSHRSTSTKNG